MPLNNGFKPTFFKKIISAIYGRKTKKDFLTQGINS